MNFIDKFFSFRYLSVDLIDVNPDQPRVRFSDSSLDELAASIRKYGILQPLIVKKTDRHSYELIAGERRIRAAIRAGLDKVPVIVRDASMMDSALLALIENLQRQDLSFLEEAKALQRLIDFYGLSQAQVAERVGKSQSAISNKLRILSLPEDALSKILLYHLSERHARALLSLSDISLIDSVIDRIHNEHFTVSQTEALIHDLNAGVSQNSSKLKSKRRINYRIYVNTLKKAFHTVQASESNAQLFEEDKGEMVEMRILIPKFPDGSLCKNLPT